MTRVQRGMLLPRRGEKKFELCPLADLARKDIVERG